MQLIVKHARTLHNVICLSSKGAICRGGSLLPKQHHESNLIYGEELLEPAYV